MNRTIFWLVAIVCMLGACVNPITKEHAMDFGENIGDGNIKGTDTGGSVAGSLIARDPNARVGKQFLLKKRHIYTVQLNLVGQELLSNIGAGNATTAAEAIVRWCVDGNTLTRRVTVPYGGTSLSGAGDSVSVDVLDVTALGPPFPPGHQTNPFTVTALVVEGARPQTAMPPVWVPGPNDSPWECGLGFLNAASSTAPFDLPNDAGINSVILTAAAVAGQPLPDGSVVVRQEYGGASIARECDFRYHGGIIPWSPRASKLVVHNYNAFQVTLNLAFGIDG